jgi:hypothetical protein
LLLAGHTAQLAHWAALSLTNNHQQQHNNKTVGAATPVTQLMLGVMLPQQALQTAASSN